MRRIARSLPIVAASVLLVAGAGCGKASEKVSEKIAEQAIEDATGGKGNVDIDGDGGIRIDTEDGSYVADGDGNVRIETEEGTYEAGGGEVPDGWPDDVALPDDLKVVSGSNMASGDQLALMIIGTTSESPSAVVDRISAASGWETTDTFSSSANGFDSVTVQLADGERQLVVGATETEADGTSLTINYTEPAAP